MNSRKPHAAARRRQRRRGAGFTLTELLVVIAIIAVLAAILVAAVYPALARADNTVVQAELSELARGIQAYRAKYGDYPPDFSNPQLVTRHYRKLFPYATESAPAGLSPAQALVFCLRGYSPDKRRPFTGPGERESFVEFDETQLSGDLYANTPPIYNQAKGKQVPYVYFDSRTYGNASFTNGSDTARPYMGPNNRWAEPRSFQIVAAGADGFFGAGATHGGTFPTGADYNSRALDNLTNFSRGTLGDDKEGQ